jgi:beta-phosphoglucomutase-like phosphatase (HAD superfamily)
MEKAFIFDLSGVITDTAEYHYLAWKQLADEEGLPFTREDNEQLRGVSRRESLLRLLKGKIVPEEIMQTRMARKNEYYIAYLENITANDLLPDVMPFLEQSKIDEILSHLLAKHSTHE